MLNALKISLGSVFIQRQHFVSKTVIKVMFAYTPFPTRSQNITMQSYATAPWEMPEIGHCCHRNASGLAVTCKFQRFNLPPGSRTFGSLSQLLCVADGRTTAPSCPIFFSRCSALCCFDHHCCEAGLSVTVNPVIISPAFLLYVCL